MTLETETEQTDSPSPTKKKSKRPKSVPLITVQKKQKVSTPPLEINSRLMEQSGNDSEEVGSEVVEGSRTSKPNLSFQEVGTFEDFHIMVKGTCIDSEFPDDVRRNYYKLCISRNELLHDALPEGMYCKLVAGMIGETVNIANEIKNCKPTTTKEEFEAWDNSLKSFGLLGMKVGFLRDRIVTLSRLMFESEGRLDVQKYMEAKNEQEHVEDEIISVSLKLVELKETSRNLKGIVDGLKPKSERYEVMFQEEVNSPW